MKKDSKWPLYIEVTFSKYHGLRGYAYSETQTRYKVTLFKDGKEFKTELSKKHVKEIKSWKGKRNEKTQNNTGPARSSSDTPSKQPKTNRAARAAQRRNARAYGEAGYLKSNY